MAAPHVVAVLGPTATGKSALALALAERLERSGLAIELVSVDSMQVYRGMDIGTAKPSASELAAVPHHLIDVLDPDEEGSVSWFQAEADVAMAALRARGATPMLVGGTGLYHRSVIDGLAIPGRFPEVTSGLELEPDTTALHRRLAELDPAAAARMEPTNRRRVVRALEVTIGTGRRFSSFGPGLESYPANDVVQVGLRVDRNDLGSRLEHRFDEQMRRGFLDEVSRLDARTAGWSRTAAQALGYRELRAHLAGEMDLDTAIATAIVRTRQFAVRQDRWFRRDPRVTWFDASEPNLVAAVLDHAESCRTSPIASLR